MGEVVVVPIPCRIDVLFLFIISGDDLKTDGERNVRILRVGQF